MNKIIEFCVAGRPVGKQRPRVVKNGSRAFTPAKTKAYEKMIRIAVLQGKANARREGRLPITGPYRVEIRIVWADKRHPDIDNVAKAILDGMNGIAYPDDKEVTQLNVEVFGTDKAGCGVGVRVTELEAK